MNTPTDPLEAEVDKILGVHLLKSDERYQAWTLKTKGLILALIHTREQQARTNEVEMAIDAIAKGDTIGSKIIRIGQHLGNRLATLTKGESDE